MNAAEHSTLVFFCRAMKAYKNLPEKRKDLVAVISMPKEPPRSDELMEYIARFDGGGKDDDVLVATQILNEIR